MSIVCDAKSPSRRISGSTGGFFVEAILTPRLGQTTTMNQTTMEVNAEMLAAETLE